MPNLVGKTYADAQAAAESVGLKVARSAFEPSDQPDDTVLSQDPSSGSVDPGTTIKLTLALGDQTVPVPDLRGRSESEALNLIAAAKLTIGTRTDAFDDFIPVGNVVSQDPGPGVVVTQGLAVNYVISKGPEPTPTPSPSPTPSPTPPPTAAPTPTPTPGPRNVGNYVCMTLGAATAALQADGFAVGTVTPIAPGTPTNAWVVVRSRARQPARIDHGIARSTWASTIRSRRPPRARPDRSGGARLAVCFAEERSTLLPVGRDASSRGPSPAGGPEPPEAVAIICSAPARTARCSASNSTGTKSRSRSASPERRAGLRRPARPVDRGDGSALPAASMLHARERHPAAIEPAESDLARHGLPEVPTGRTGGRGSVADPAAGRLRLGCAAVRAPPHRHGRMVAANAGTVEAFTRWPVADAVPGRGAPSRGYLMIVMVFWAEVLP